MSYICFIETSFPENVYQQEEIRDLVISLWPHQQEIINQFFESTCVKTRNLALPLLEYKKMTHFGDRNNIWKEVALSLQKKNIENIFSKNNISPTAISLISSVNSTGLCVPTLEALLMNLTPIGHNTKRIPIFGLGCLGGVAGINRIHDYLLGFPKEAALLLITELCSLTYQLQDCSIPNIVGSALFGDGSGAVLIVGKENLLAQSAFLEIISTKSYFYPDTEHYMGWKMVESGFELELSNEIPNLIKKNLGKDLHLFINECGFEQKNIKFFIAHPGGPKILHALVEAIKGNEEDFKLSWKSLSEHGNLSSVSVIDVLQKSINRKDIKKDDLGIMLSTGPAFSLELTLVKKC